MFCCHVASRGGSDPRLRDKIYIHICCNITILVIFNAFVTVAFAASPPAATSKSVGLGEIISYVNDNIQLLSVFLIPTIGFACVVFYKAIKLIFTIQTLNDNIKEAIGKIEKIPTICEKNRRECNINSKEFHRDIINNVCTDKEIINVLVKQISQSVLLEVSDSLGKIIDQHFESRGIAKYKSYKVPRR